MRRSATTTTPAQTGRNGMRAASLGGQLVGVTGLARGNGASPALAAAAAGAKRLLDRCESISAAPPLTVAISAHAAGLSPAEDRYHWRVMSHLGAYVFLNDEQRRGAARTSLWLAGGWRAQ